MNYLVDTHCHYYPKYNPNNWINSACTNFSRTINRNDLDLNKTECVIILTERSSENYLTQIPSLFNDISIVNQIEFKDNYYDLKLNHEIRTIKIFPAKQSISLEGIEVLTYGHYDLNSKLKDKIPLNELLSIGINSCKLTCLPWSYGKWLGKRKQLITESLSNLSNENLKKVCLGDIYGRPFLDNSLKLISNHFNLSVISGSDCLPMKNDEKSVALKLNIFEKNIDFWSDLINSVESKKVQTNSLNPLSETIDGIVRQIKLRL